eukprot:15453784-Alexandrium_andersonii.AAC.1
MLILVQLVALRPRLQEVRRLGRGRAITGAARRWRGIVGVDAPGAAEDRGRRSRARRKPRCLALRRRR